MLVDVALVVRSQERAFVAYWTLGSLNHFRHRKFGVIWYWRGRDDLIDNLVGILLQHPDRQNDVIATCGLAFVGTALAHCCSEFGNISSIGIMSESV